MVRFLLYTALVSALAAMSVDAFSPVSISLRTRNVALAPTSTARNILLTDEETANIMQSAQDCADSECSVEDVETLITDLKQQQKEMSVRLEEIMNMVAHLQKLNVDDKRKKEDVRAYVKDLMRVFDTSKGGFASGFSGDIGDGPTDAYKALNPKPWKAAP